MDPYTRPHASDIYGVLRHNENIIQPLLASPAFAKIRENESTEMDMSPAPLKSGPLWKKPMLRQSSSVISVDSKYSSHLAPVNSCHSAMVTSLT